MPRRHRRWLTTIPLLVAAVVITVVVASAKDRPAPWRTLAAGLEVGRFSLDDRAPAADGDLVAVRVDLTHWQLGYHAAVDHGDRERTVEDWATEFGLAAVVNAGMYQADRRSHVGFLQIDGKVRNPSANDYLSAAAFDPRRRNVPPFGIFDLDLVPLDSVRARYGTVVQNLRLIKRPRDNRWAVRDKGWAEAALGEDAHGRVLFLFCLSARSMHDLNEALLALPLELVAAQHLEGNLPAQMHIAAGGYSLSVPEGVTPPPIPNVLGVRRRT
jgi:hypothetical protein